MLNILDVIFSIFFVKNVLIITILLFIILCLNTCIVIVIVILFNVDFNESKAYDRFIRNLVF